MKILGIDTSTKFLAIGAYDGTKVYEHNVELGVKHSSLLMPTIERILQALGWDIRDIDYFACGLGPGSFTGMRIGVATVKGLSIVGNKPVVGISSLDILAKNVNPGKGLIVTALDARRGLIYCSSYRYDNGLLKRKSRYALLSLEEFLRRFGPRSIILGDALALYANKISTSIKGATILDKDYWGLKANNLMELALMKIKARQFTLALKVKPIYLYPKECQIKTK